MGSGKARGRSGGLSRREALGRIAATLGFAAAVALPLRLFRGGRPGSAQVKGQPLPSKGSIFEPRQDDRLREWLRRNSG